MQAIDPKADQDPGESPPTPHSVYRGSITLGAPGTYPNRSVVSPRRLASTSLRFLMIFAEIRG